MRIALFYGSTLGTAKAVAESIAEKIAVDLFDVSKGIEDMRSYEKIILGTNTWGYGELQDDWESVRAAFEKIDFSGKKVAIYSTGDGEGYPDTFVDAIGILGEIVEKNGGSLVAFTETEGYNFSDSKALRDGKFIGLAIDDNNQSSMTETRIKNWVEILKGEF